MRTEYIWTAEKKREMWGEGTWVDEPDLVEWEPEEAPELVGLIRRHDELGMLCGYVGVPPAHPWHGQSKERIGDDDQGWDVGLTYVGLFAVEDGPSAINTKRWWVGFDCAHWLDVIPFMERLRSGFRRSLRPSSGLPEPTYKHFRWVRTEVEKACAHSD